MDYNLMRSCGQLGPGRHGAVFVGAIAFALRPGSRKPDRRSRPDSP